MLLELRNYVSLCIIQIGNGNWSVMVIEVTLAGNFKITDDIKIEVKNFYNWLEKIPLCKIDFSTKDVQQHSVTISYRR